jgi:DNA repair protein RecN (Recombination protein N)
MLRRLRIENLVLIREADLCFSPGLNAVTGETGAGKTILAQAIGLLLGTKGDAAAIGAAGDEAYVEAELDVPEGFFDDEPSALAELRPADEDGLVLARRVFRDGRTRGYAWGRAIARDDLAAATERLIAMSGQFEQRRLARSAYQLAVLDAYCGAEQERRLRAARTAWHELLEARRRHHELVHDADAVRARRSELTALVDDTADLEPGEEDRLREQRERLRHVHELGLAAATAVEAVEPEDGVGAGSLAVSAERALAPFEPIAPELASAAAELRDITIRLRDVAGELRRFSDSLDADPATLDEVEQRLERWSDLRRRYQADTADELLERRDAARAELDAAAGGVDPVDAAAAALSAAEESMSGLASELHDARNDAAGPFAAQVAAELHDVGMGEGEFVARLAERELGATGSDDVSFLVRANTGLPHVPVASTASGGELSRIALAIAAAAGGETLVFDEIDAGIGGTTAHRVAETLRRLGDRAQVLTITHLPQIASVADAHFRVEKLPGDPTQTRIEPLEPDERRAELERMLGGEEFLTLVARGTDGDSAAP